MDVAVAMDVREHVTHHTCSLSLTKWSCQIFQIKSKLLALRLFFNPIRNITSLVDGNFFLISRLNVFMARL